MTQYQLGGSSSPSVSLTVTNFPAITIPSVTGPSSPQLAGASLACTFTASNSGGDGSVIFTLKNQAGTTLGTTTVGMTTGQLNVPMQINFTMPGVDTTLTVTSNYGGSASRTVQVLISVATNLTLSLNPTNVKVGDTVSVSGKLSRADGGTTGLSGATINVYNVQDGLTKATCTCDSNGNYSGSFTAPSVEGTPSYRASYGGSGYLASSLSGEEGIQIGEGGINPLLVLGALGLILVLAKGKKRR